MTEYEIELRRGNLYVTKTEEGKPCFYHWIDLAHLREQLPALVESRKILKEMLEEIESILREAPTKLE